MNSCQTNNLMDSSLFDNEETKSEWISLENTDHTVLSSCFHTVEFIEYFLLHIKYISFLIVIMCIRPFRNN